jgi:ornithine cyclodeaminase
VLSEDELRRCIGFDAEALDAVESSFASLSGGGVSMPPVMHISVDEPPGDIDVKGAYIPGVATVAVKVASGFFGNRHLGLPSSSALMVLLSARTGRCEAVMLDNGYLTDLRTGLAGAVAARHLARPGRLRVGVLGAGAQARYQVEALTIESRVKSVAVFAPRAEQAEAYAMDISHRQGMRLGIPVTIEVSAEAVVRGCDLLVTTTPSQSPLVSASWLRPGLHVTAMGSDLPGKREIARDALTKADRLVVDSLSQSRLIGELQSFADDSPEVARAESLGDIIRELNRPPRDAGAISICDLTGVGVQDTAIAALALARARALGLGLNIA